MNDESTSEALVSSATQAVSATGDGLASMAMLGKTAAALAFVIGIILLLSYLLKRVQFQQAGSGQRLRVVGSTAVGQRERVVIVEVSGTWLVLGVATGRVNKLYDMPAPENQGSPDTGGATSFSQRLSQSLHQRRSKAADISKGSQ